MKSDTFMKLLYDNRKNFFNFRDDPDHILDLRLRPYKFDNLDDETFRRKIIGAGGRGK